MSKTLSFACIHFTVAFLVGYLMTGSVWVGGALALIEPACNTVAFHLHEKVWKKIELRRAEQAIDKQATAERAVTEHAMTARTVTKRAIKQHAIQEHAVAERTIERRAITEHPGNDHACFNAALST